MGLGLYAGGGRGRAGEDNATFIPRMIQKPAPRTTAKSSRIEQLTHLLSSSLRTPLQLLKLFRQLRPRREQRRAIGRHMPHVHHVALRVAVFLQYVTDDGTGGGDVRDCEEAMVVFVLLCKEGG